MALKDVISLDIDFYDKKYILINAKQFDRNSRFISITCYNHGKILPINSGEYSAYVRYRKSDSNGVFNFCEIDRKGKILVELTEQMLASAGICCADLVIVDKGKASVDANTGTITSINNASILSTMTFYIDVLETPLDNYEIESSYEYNGLNEAIARVEADFENVILASKSWAVGNTGLRDGEDLNNAKYYAELALKNAYGGDSIVTGIKCTNDTDYRNGQVTISADDVGAIPIENIVTVGELKNYLGIE